MTAVTPTTPTTASPTCAASTAAPWAPCSARRRRFPSVAAGTAAADNVVPVVLQNTGDAPLTITALAIQADALDVGSANDFAIVSQNCTAAGGGPLAASTLVADDPATAADETAYATPRGTCTVNVGFKPTRSGYQSVARLQVTSGSDAATESIPLSGLSTNSAIGSVGGTVASMLSLTLGSTPSFGAFVPAVARTYDAARHGDRGQHRRRRDAVGLGCRHRQPGQARQRRVRSGLAADGPRDQRRADQPGLRAGHGRVDAAAHATRRRRSVPSPSRSASARRSAPPTSCARATTASRSRSR